MTNHCLENKLMANNTILKVEPNTQKQKLFEELEITKQKKHLKNLMNTITNVESQKLPNNNINKRTNYLNNWTIVHYQSNNKIT